MAIIHVTNENFNEIKSGAKPVLLDFFATWCGPCRMVGPILEEIAEERDDVVIGKIDVDECPELAQAFGVSSIPTLVLLKDGEEIDRALGARPKDSILDFIEG